MDDKRAGSRRIVGFAMAASAVILLVMASLIYTGTFGVALQSRTIVAGAMAVAAVLDVVLAIYFIVSDPS
jgi:hypothetical protein